MTENHPITPPPELVQQWRNEGYGLHSPVSISGYVATRAAQWGADKEREAICERLEYLGWHSAVQDIRASRCPKPRSLKQEALEELDAAILRGDCFSTSIAKDIIRRALEQLPTGDS